jgi:hypothetical protein
VKRINLLVKFIFSTFLEQCVDYWRLETNGKVFETKKEKIYRNV